MTLRRRWYLFEEASEISREDVIDILASQPGNKGKSRDELSRWVVSDSFRLDTIHAGLNQLGVSHGKTGETRSQGKPIIVDKNERMVARFHQGIGGGYPDFLVLDGQNRVVSARKKSVSSKLRAYIGDKIYSQLKDQDREAEQIFSDLELAIKGYLNTPRMPGAKLVDLESYVRRGILSRDELDLIRKEWKRRHAKG